MSENTSLDETIANLRIEAQEALKNVILENKQRFEASLQNRQQHIIEKLNPNLIKFNIGGYKFVTTLDTLSNIKETKLHKIATGRYPITLDAKNRIFIDRNGKYFGYVLDCLRKGNIEFPSDPFLSSRVQKECEFFELVNINSTNVTPSLLGGIKTVSLTSKQISKGNYTWRLSPETKEDCSGRISLEATDGEELQARGDTLLTSGTHQWRFFIEELASTPPPKQLDDEFADEEYNGGIVTFGVMTKKIWKKLKDHGDLFIICGFDTIGQCFNGDDGSKKKKGLQAEGPKRITEIGCQNQEFTLTFNTQTGVLKLTVKGQEKSHMLKINESAGNAY